MGFPRKWNQARQSVAAQQQQQKTSISHTWKKDTPSKLTLVVCVFKTFCAASVNWFPPTSSEESDMLVFEKFTFGVATQKSKPSGSTNAGVLTSTFSRERVRKRKSSKHQACQCQFVLVSGRGWGIAKAKFKTYCHRVEGVERKARVRQDSTQNSS